MSDEEFIRIPVRWHGSVSLQSRDTDDRDGTITIVVYQPSHESCSLAPLNPKQALDLAKALTEWAEKFK